MNIGEIIFYPIVLISLILLLVTGFVVLRNGLRNQQKNLIILSIAYFLTVTFYILLTLTELWLFINLVLAAIYFCILFFVRMTFYSKTKKTFRIMLVIMIITSVVMIYFAVATYTLQIYERNVITRSIDVFSMLIISVPVFLWYALLADRNSKNFKKKDIEPWIYIRLRIISLSSIIGAFLFVPDLLRINPEIAAADPDDPISLAVFSLQAIVTIFYGISQFIAWVMPPKLKDYYNQKHGYVKNKDQLESLSEEDILKQLRGDQDE